MSKNQVTAATAEKGLVASASTTYNMVIAFLAFFTAIGIAAGIHAFFIGHEHAYGVTREVPWGLLIATYVFFVVTSTGLCLVSSIGHVFGVHTLKPIAKRSVFLSIATIVSGFLVIAFEIENPWRMAIYNVISPNLTSNIWWMGTLYGAYLFFMLVEFALLQVEKHREAGLFGLLGVISGVAAHSNLGAVFGLLTGREFWHGPYMPIYFIASAMLSGCAAILFFTYLAYSANGWKMSSSLERALGTTGKIGLLLIAVLAFFDCWKILSGIAGQPPGKYEATMALVAGDYAANFWFGEIGLGLVAPFVLILAARMKNTRVMFVAGLLSLVGIFFMRYDLVVVGQLVPHFHDMDIVGLPHLYSYSPSVHEILITLGGLSLCGMLFLMGERLFRGHVSEAH